MRSNPLDGRSLTTGARLSVGDELAIELAVARSKTGLVGSLVHRYHENNATAAIAATNRRHNAEIAAVKSATELVEAHRDFQVAAVRGRVQDELVNMMLHVGREELLLTMQARLSKAQEASLIAQRSAVSARHSLEAASAFKALNFEIGAARKEAEIAETRDAIPEPKRRMADNRFELADAVGLRAELRSRGVDVPDALNRLIDQLRDEHDLRPAAE